MYASACRKGQGHRFYWRGASLLHMRSRHTDRVKLGDLLGAIRNNISRQSERSLYRKQPGTAGDVLFQRIVL